MKYGMDPVTQLHKDKRGIRFIGAQGQWCPIYLKIVELMVFILNPL